MIVVDTSALFAFLASEPDALQLISVMRASVCLVGAPTWVEASIVVHRKLGADGSARLTNLAQALQFNLISFDRGLAEAAFEAHRQYGRGTGHRADLNFG